MDTVDQHFEFHRLARSAPGYRWWKPLLTALLGVVFYVVFTIIVMVPAVLFAVFSPTGVEPYLDALTVLDLSNPVVFAIAMVSLILLIPSLALATLIMGPRPIGLLSSITGRIRWRWLLVCSGAALAVFAVSIGLSLLVELFLPSTGVTPPPMQQDATTLVLLVALSLLAVPFQAAAEEYVFRGFLMQTIGGWLRHPAFAILLPVPLFVLGHGYDPLGQVDVAVFAVFAGWITWRTGGLEAAIAVHAVNNVTIFLLGAVGLADVNATGSSLSGLIVSVLTMAVTTALLVRLADRRGIRRTRVVTPQPPMAYGYPPGYPLLPAGGHHPYAAPQQVSFQGQVTPWPQGQPQGAPQQGAPSAPDPRHSDAPPHPQPSAAAPAPSLPVPPPAPPAASSSTEPSAAAPAVAPSAGPAPTRHPVPAAQAPGPLSRTGTPQPPASSDPSGTPHPVGTAHPSGTAFPPGVAHPPGPGFPGRVPPGGYGARQGDDASATVG